MNFIEELKKYIILEHDLQQMEFIECSFSGELVPLEVVEGLFDKYLKEMNKNV